MSSGQAYWQDCIDLHSSLTPLGCEQAQLLGKKSRRALQGLRSLVVLAVSLLQGRAPVRVLHSSSLSPASALLSFPSLRTAIPGTVSTICWLWCCDRTSSSLLAVLTTSLQLPAVKLKDS